VIPAFRSRPRFELTNLCRYSALASGSTAEKSWFESW
jgi:hypothetical protein